MTSHRHKDTECNAELNVKQYFRVLGNVSKAITFRQTAALAAFRLSQLYRDSMRRDFDKSRLGFHMYAARPNQGLLIINTFSYKCLYFLTIKHTLYTNLDRHLSKELS